MNPRHSAQTHQFSKHFELRLYSSGKVLRDSEVGAHAT